MPPAPSPANPAAAGEAPEHAWWQRAWVNVPGSAASAGADNVAAPTPVVVDTDSSDTRVANEPAQLARLPAPPTDGYTPAKGVIEPYKRRSYQGFAPLIPPTDAARARSTNTDTYVGVSYDDWDASPKPPVPPAALLVDRVQIPVHPVFDRAPVPVPQGRTTVYQ